MIFISFWALKKLALLAFVPKESYLLSSKAAPAAPYG